MNQPVMIVIGFLVLSFTGALLIILYGFLETPLNLAFAGGQIAGVSGTSYLIGRFRSQRQSHHR